MQFGRVLILVLIGIEVLIATSNVVSIQIGRRYIAWSNFIIGLIHLTVVVAFVSLVDNVHDSPIIYTNTNWTRADIKVETLGQINIYYPVVLSGFTSGTVHIYRSIATRFKNEFIPAPMYKWIDYTLSATLIIIALYSLSGVVDVFVYIFAIVIQSKLLIIGGCLEHTYFSVNGATKSRWIDYILMTSIAIIYSTIWVPILYITSGDGVPEWVIALNVFLFLLYSSFFLVYLLYRYRWKEYQGGFSEDRSYSALSVTSKLALEIIIIFGSLAQADIQTTDILLFVFIIPTTTGLATLIGLRYFAPKDVIHTRSSHDFKILRTS